MSERRRVIDDIRHLLLVDINVDDEKVLAGVHHLQRSLHLACETLSCELYSKDSRLTMELVQNADDNKYPDGAVPSLSFELSTSALTIRNNECGFSEEDLRALCGVRSSTKTSSSECTGEKGIGFKSVFRVSDTPHVLSNGFSFRFEAGNVGRKTSDDHLGYIVPHWVEEFPIQPESDTPLTIIHLPFRENESFEVSHLFGDLHATMLLFLRRLTILEWVLRDGPKVTQKMVLRRTDVDGAVEVLKEKCGPTINSIEKASFFVHKLRFSKPDRLANEARRLHVSEVEVTCAFPVNEDKLPISLPKGSPNLFAFLPIKDIGFRFLANTDFLLPASRENLLECEWNCWLRSCLLQVFLKAITDVFQHQTRLRCSYFSFLPLEGEVRDSVMESFAKELFEELVKHRCIPTDMDQFQLPKEVIIIEPDDAPIRILFDSRWFKIALNVVPISPEVDTSKHRKVFEMLKCLKFSHKELLACLKQSNDVSRQSPYWFRRLYDYIATRHRLKWVSFQNLQIFPIQDDDAFVVSSKGPVFMLPAKGGNRNSEAASEDLMLASQCRERNFLINIGIPLLHREAAPDVDSLAYKFLLQIGLLETTPSNVIKLYIIPFYQNIRWEASRKIGHDKLLEHFRYIDHVSMGGRNGLDGIVNECKSSLRLRAMPAYGSCRNDTYAFAKDCYFDTPEVRKFLDGTKNVYFVHPQYEQSLDHGRGLLRAFGVSDEPRLEVHVDKVGWNDKAHIRQKYGAQPKYDSFDEYYVTTMRFPSHLVDSVRRDSNRLMHMLELLDMRWSVYAAQLRLQVHCFYWNDNKKCRHGKHRCKDPACAQIDDLTNDKGVREKLSEILLADLRKCKVVTRSEGAKALADCYARTDLMVELFQDNAPYVPFDFTSQDFRVALGISGEPSVAVMLQRLESLAGYVPARQIATSEIMKKRQTIAQSDIDLIQRIYRALNAKAQGYWKTLQQEFRTKALIVVPLQDARTRYDHREVVWCTTNQLCWTGDKEERAVFASTFYFAKDAHWELGEFFLGRLELRNRIDFLDVLTQLHVVARDSNAEQTAHLRILYRMLSSRIGRLLDQGRSVDTSNAFKELDRLGDSKTQPIFRTTRGTFVHASKELVIPDDDELLNIFRAQNKAQLLDVPSNMIVELRNLANYFGLERLSDRVDSSLVQSCLSHARLDEPCTHVLRSSIPHVARCLAYFRTECLYESEVKATVARWTELARDLQVKTVRNLAVEMWLHDQRAHAIQKSCQVHLDVEGITAYVDEQVMQENQQAAWQAVALEVLRLFSHGLSGDRRESLEFCVQLLLSLKSEDMEHIFETNRMFKKMPTLPVDVSSALSEAVGQGGKRDRSSLSHGHVTVLTSKTHIEPYAISSCTSVELARLLCDELVKSGKARPEKARSQCSKLATLFTDAGIDGASLAQWGQESLRSIIRGARDGDRSWLTDVEDELIKLWRSLPRADNSFTEADYQQQFVEHTWNEGAYVPHSNLMMEDHCAKWKSVRGQGCPDCMSPSVARGTPVLYADLEDRVMEALQSRGGQMNLHDMFAVCPGVRKQDLKYLKTVEVVRDATGVTIMRPRRNSQVMGSAAAAAAYNNGNDNDAQVLPCRNLPDQVTNEMGAKTSPKAEHSKRLPQREEQITDMEVPPLMMQIHDLLDKMSETPESDALMKHVSAFAVGARLTAGFDAGFREGVQAVRASQLQPLRDVEMAIKTVWNIYQENHGPKLMRGIIKRELSEPLEEEIDVSEVRFSQYAISSVFGSGQHRGEPIQNLVNALEEGCLEPGDLPLKAAKFNGRVHSLNNRRLWAFKEFKRRYPERAVRIRVQVYDLCPLTAKFILTYSTADEGLTVDFSTTLNTSSEGAPKCSETEVYIDEDT